MKIVRVELDDKDREKIKKARGEKSQKACALEAWPGHKSPDIAWNKIERQVTTLDADRLKVALSVIGLTISDARITRAKVSE